MFSWFALIIMVSFGVASFRYFSARGRIEASKLENMEAIHLVEDFVRLTRTTDLNPSQKHKQLRAIQSRMCDFYDARRTLRQHESVENVTYLDTFGRNAEKRKEAGA